MELSEIKGLGPTRLESLRAMGIVSLRDFLLYLPRSYEDMTEATPCGSAMCGMTVLVIGTVEENPKLNRFGGMTRVTAAVRDETGRMPCVWYNQPWVTQQLHAGDPVMLFGRVGDKNGRRVLQNPARVQERTIRPVYKAVKGIPAKSFREMMEKALAQVDDCCPETLPRGLRMRYDLCELNYAIRQSHFPDHMEALKLARRRMAFERLLMYQMTVAEARGSHQAGFAFDIQPGAQERFWTRLPFPPTGAQRRVLGEIAEDLTRDQAMSRLVQGDVGCGKTALAFGAIALTKEAGYQAAMMAPTDILARQHYEAASALLTPMGIRCGLVTGSMKASERKAAQKAMTEGEWDAVFGTHALVSEKTGYAKLGLVITDEQHRFGVRQRSVLQEKGCNDGRYPHVLVMSATPIPRTLALILYGDLDVSIVDELPPGRCPVQTRIVPQEKRAGMYRFLREQVAGGKQAYVVCPLVEESESLGDVRSAKETWDTLKSGELNGLRVGLTWGSQPPAEKAETLRSFAAGELDVLVSTTVIEVGVNVPNATVMVIENAERYGLSQLHQLRGRVGRGGGESWCFLLADGTERLRILTATNDGFEVSRKDLELRGPGDLTGTRQSGETLAGMILDGDVRLLEETSRCVRELYQVPAYADELEQVKQEALRYGLPHIALN